MRQRKIAFGHANEINRIAGRHAERKSVRIREPDVFDRHAHNAASNVVRVLAGFQHSCEPVKRGIRIAVAYGLVQSRNKVVVLFAGFVVEQNTFLQSVVDDGVGNKRWPEARLLARARLAATSNAL